MAKRREATRGRLQRSLRVRSDCITYLQCQTKFPIMYRKLHLDYRRGDSTCGVLRTVTGCASCHSLSPENATHLAGTGVQVLIYMGQMQPASSSVGGSVDARLDPVCVSIRPSFSFIDVSVIGLSETRYHTIVKICRQSGEFTRRDFSRV